MVSVVYLFCLVERHEHERNGAKFGIISSGHCFLLFVLVALSKRHEHEKSGSGYLLLFIINYYLFSIFNLLFFPFFVLASLCLSVMSMRKRIRISLFFGQGFSCYLFC